MGLKRIRLGQKPCYEEGKSPLTEGVAKYYQIFGLMGKFSNQTDSNKKESFLATPKEIDITIPFPSDFWNTVSL